MWNLFKSDNRLRWRRIPVPDNGSTSEFAVIDLGSGSKVLFTVVSDPTINLAILSIKWLRSDLPSEMCVEKSREFRNLEEAKALAQQIADAERG